MPNYIVDGTALASIANAIRSKGGTTASLAFPNAFITAINDISTGSKIRHRNNLVTNVGEYMFHDFSGLNEVYLPNCTNVSKLAYAGCCDLTDVYLPKCLTVWSSAFQSCSALETITLSSCASIYDLAFDHCTKLQSIELPACKVVQSSAFQYCSALSKVTLGNCSSIYAYAFRGCVSLSALYLTGSSVTQLGTPTAVFYGTPLYSKIGSIFVPASLMESYLANSRWKFFSTILVGIGT